MLKVSDFAQLEQEITRLKGEIELRDHRIKQLTEERDAERKLVTEMREHVEQANERIEDGQRMVDNWIEGFDMILNDDGNWTWSKFVQDCEDIANRYMELQSKWNRHVGEFNEFHASKFRPIGRPLQASAAQCSQVLKLRAKGCSYREIIDDTGLSIQTIRTIINRGTKDDRTIKRHAELQKITMDRGEQVRWRARKRTRDQVTVQLNGWLKETDELGKAGRELLKR